LEFPSYRQGAKNCKGRQAQKELKIRGVLISLSMLKVTCRQNILRDLGVHILGDLGHFWRSGGKPKLET